MGKNLNPTKALSDFASNPLGSAMKLGLQAGMMYATGGMAGMGGMGAMNPFMKGFAEGMMKGGNPLGGALGGMNPFGSAIQNAMGFNAGTGQNPMDALTEDLPRVLNNPNSLLKHGGLEGAPKHFAGLDAEAGEGFFGDAAGTLGYKGPGADMLGDAMKGNPFEKMLQGAFQSFCPFGCVGMN